VNELSRSRLPQLGRGQETPSGSGWAHDDEVFEIAPKEPAITRKKTVGLMACMRSHEKVRHQPLARASCGAVGAPRGAGSGGVSTCGLPQL